MTQDIKGVKTSDLMAEAMLLQDKIENIELYTAEELLRLEALYDEIECRGYSIVDLCIVQFIESRVSKN